MQLSAELPTSDLNFALDLGVEVLGEDAPRVSSRIQMTNFFACSKECDEVFGDKFKPFFPGDTAR